MAGDGSLNGIDAANYPDDWLYLGFPLDAVDGADSHIPLLYCDRDLVLDHAYLRLTALSSDSNVFTLKAIPSGTNISAAGTPLTTGVDTSAGMTAHVPAELSVIRTANVIPAGSTIVASRVGAATTDATGLNVTIRLRSKKT